jgi:hypothetical protein
MLRDFLLESAEDETTRSVVKMLWSFFFTSLLRQYSTVVSTLTAATLILPRLTAVAAEKDEIRLTVSLLGNRDL